MKSLPTSFAQVRVHVLPTGFLWLPDHWIFKDGDRSRSELVPDYSFLICHSSGRNVLFDLGLRKDISNYPTKVRNDFDVLCPYVPNDAYDLLARGPVKPNQIDQIYLSHMHFDHTGDIMRFPDAEILIGPGSLEAAKLGFPDQNDSPFDGNFFTHPHVRELRESQYQPLPRESVPADFPWASGFDVFGDGSFFILDAPGHMKGHQIAIARTGPNEWVAMGGDCCHSRELLENKSVDIATQVGCGPAGSAGMHKFPDIARATITKTQKLHHCDNILMVLAHDACLEGSIPNYPKSLNGWLEPELKSVGGKRPLALKDVKKRHGRTKFASICRKIFRPMLSCFS